MTLANDCSGGKLQYSPAPIAAATDGVVEVTVAMDVAGVPVYREVENAAREAFAFAVGLVGSDDYTNVIFVVSREAAWDGAAAYAYVNGKVSFFRDTYIMLPGVVMHELGHNWGLRHSGEPNQDLAAYNDHTCLMGNPR